MKQTYSYIFATIFSSFIVLSSCNFQQPNSTINTNKNSKITSINNKKFNIKKETSGELCLFPMHVNLSIINLLMSRNQFK